MPDRDMREHQPRSGPSDEFQIPVVNKDFLPGVMEAGQGGGGSASWETLVRRADGLTGPAKKAMLEKALEVAKASLASDDEAEANRAAGAVNQISAGLTTGVAAAASSQERGSGAREVIKPERGLVMEMRGRLIAAITRGSLDENALNGELLGLVADKTKKRKDLIILDEDIKREFIEEIRARIEMQKASNYWVGLKSESLPLKKLRETATQIPALSPETEKWLERENHDCSYVDEETGARIEVADLATEVDGAAKRLREAMGKPKEDSSSINLWKAITPRDYFNEAKKITQKENVGVLAIQLAEVGIWAAEIEVAEEGFRHPAADIVNYARARYLAASKGKPTLNGHRLFQEYQEKNRGALPADESVFSPEGKSLGRTELDFWEGARQAVRNGMYLHERKRKRGGRTLSFSEEVKADLEAACLYLTTMNELTAAESAIDPSSLVGKFYGAKLSLGGVATRLYPLRYVSGVDINEPERKGWVSLILTETVKTGIWANSLLNKWNTKAVLNMPDLYETARLAISSQTDVGEPLYIGTSLSKEEAKRANLEFVDWFERLWNKYEPIIQFKKGNLLARGLAAYLQRDFIPNNVTTSNRGIFVAGEWRSLLGRSLLEFKRWAKTKERKMGTEKQ